VETAAPSPLARVRALNPQLSAQIAKVMFIALGIVAMVLSALLGLMDSTSVDLNAVAGGVALVVGALIMGALALFSDGPDGAS